MFNVTSHQRTVAANAQIIRSFVNDYVQKRRRGENKSELADGSDLLSVFLAAPPDIFTDEFIIDELVDFFMAASGTTNLATRTMVAHFAKCPDSLARVRKEFEDAILSQAFKEDPTLKDVEKKDLL